MTSDGENFLKITQDHDLQHIYNIYNYIFIKNNLIINRLTRNES